MAPKTDRNNLTKRDDVARLAGVSGTTVSFVYSKKRYVSPELTERVLRAAKELNYHPDMVAASMGSGRTNSIAVLTDDIVSPLQMEIVSALQEAAIDAGFFVHICGGTKKLGDYIHNLISRKVDGVFLSVPLAAVGNEGLSMLLDRGISVIVTSSRGFSDDRVCGLELDFTYGMKLILEYLGSLGHRDIAFVSCYDEAESGDRRLPAFRRYMRELFGREDPLVEMGEPPYESTIERGFLLTDRLLARSRDFSALVCTNDMMAYGALRALREKGIRVPEQVSVVGIDDIIFSRSFTPALTTLSHCSQEYGRRIFEILLANIEDKSCVIRDTVRPRLVVRQSTGPCPDLPRG